MSGILEFFSYTYICELEGIDTGEKCLGNHENPWSVGCEYGVTLGKVASGFSKAAKTGDWRRDPCAVHCGKWRRVRRLRIGRFKIDFPILHDKFDIHTPTAINGVRGTTFTIDVADDGVTLIAVLEGAVEVIDKKCLRGKIVYEGQQITIDIQKPIDNPCKAAKELLDDLSKWKENINEESIDELDIPDNTIIELPKGRLNYTRSERNKGGD